MNSLTAETISPGIHKDMSFTQNRELSWLKFNERVMAQALDPDLPLMERLRFVAIFTSNLDEFFMVRVGSLMDMDMLAPNERDNKSGMTPREQVSAICQEARELVARRDEIFRGLSAELSQAGVTELSYEELTSGQKDFVQEYYKENIRPLLSPQVIDRSHPFPHLQNRALYAAALLTPAGKAAAGSSKEKEKEKEKEKGKTAAPKAQTLLGIVDVPQSIPGIIQVPGDGITFIRTENVILGNLKKIFKIYELTEKAVISITRNADITLSEELFEEQDDNSGPDFLHYMQALLKKRTRLAPVRLELEGKAPKLTKLLSGYLKLGPEFVFHSECPLKFGYMDQLEHVPSRLFYKPYTPVYPDYLDPDRPVWEQVAQKDVLLFYPYQSMQPFLDLLRQSARDPNVVSIRITIYRMARNSIIAKTLCDAAENGKEVTVLMELRARFDEQNNIDWAREMEEAGCRIIYGPEKLKCHAKLCLITRKERGGLSYLAQVGTGNYNEKTSRQYTDFCLMTTNRDITREAVNFFENMLIGNSAGEYDTLFVAPYAMKNRIMELIDEQITLGSEGRIRVKVNSVSDRELIEKLSEASRAGVRIDLIVRGISCILPGIPDRTENISVTSMVGRFLEHGRIYAFGEGEKLKLYISSADFMTRNQDRRVEIAAPVLDPELKRFLEEYMERILADNVKGWQLGSDGEYTLKKPGDNEPINVQAWYMDHPVTFTKPVAAKPGFREKLLRLLKR